jgi:hypothetical protein
MHGFPAFSSWSSGQIFYLTPPVTQALPRGQWPTATYICNVCFFLTDKVIDNVSDAGHIGICSFGFPVCKM